MFSIVTQEAQIYVINTQQETRDVNFQKLIELLAQTSDHYTEHATRPDWSVGI